MSKVEKLCAASEAFADAIKGIPDERVKQLYDTFAGVRVFVAKVRTFVPKPTSSQIASGLEQGWRELPILIQGLPRQWRTMLSMAWSDATHKHYSEFYAKEHQVLQKILDRGKIRGEREYYRIRHEIDILEGESGERAALLTLYTLVNAYERPGKSR